MYEIKEIIIEKLDIKNNAVSVYEVVQDKNTALLHSGIKNEENGRYSIIGISPYLIFKGKNNKNIIENKVTGKTYKINENSFEILEKLMKKQNKIKSDLPINSGVIGYISYEKLKNIETKIILNKKDELQIPDIYFCFYKFLIIFDYIDKKTYLSTTYIEGDNNINEEKKELMKKLKNIPENHIKIRDIDIDKTNELKEYRHKYINMVKRIKEYIINGDVYQVCSTYRHHMNYENNPFLLFKVLNEINPATFSSYINFGDFHIISSSIERLIRVKDNKMYSSPIKGTRPRGKDGNEDKKIIEKLKNSIKDKAENVMIVDLVRNDMGRIAVPGSIKVPDLFRIEKYSTVFQMTSYIEGEIEKGKSLFDVLKSCFPPGSMTGAPKVRAMEIIEELEETKRNIYSGTIGYIDVSGNMDFNVVMRTIILKDKKAYFNIGGGIVYDSNPEDEFIESENKAKALIKAIKIAQNLGDKNDINN